MSSLDFVGTHIRILIAELLDLEEPPLASDNMFELGVDSLMLVDLKDRIKSELAVDLRFSDFFTYFTIRDLAAAIVLLSPIKGAK